MTTPVLATSAVSRCFGPVEVLSDVSLQFDAGEVHAIVGENGAGKSTLMKILGGYLAPTRGTLEMDGRPARFASPAEAEKHGIVLVHQEILLAPDLTVAQNIFLGRELVRGFRVDDREMDRRAAAAVHELGADIAPGTQVSRLSIAQRQLVQIARALQVPHRLVIFDEPTAPLTPVETEALLKVIAAIKAKGVAILYISHRLPEVKTIAGRISVLRDGRLIGTFPATELQPLDMARLMVGRDMAKLYPPKGSARGDIVLKTAHFTVPGFAKDVGFDLRRGEILGFAGLIGAGRTELFEGLTGLRPGAGEVTLDGKPARFADARAAMKAGVVYLSEDRKGKGLLLMQDLKCNLTLAALDRYASGPMIDTGREWRALDRAFAAYDIRAGGKAMLAGQLSGGNQQKLLFAKMMELEPGVVVIDEPTRGIDIGAKQQIYALIAALAQKGKAVVVISSEMQELIGLCHRVLVMREGRIAGELAGDAITEESIVVFATGAGHHSAGHA